MWGNVWEMPNIAYRRVFGKCPIEYTAFPVVGRKTESATAGKVSNTAVIINKNKSPEKSMGFSSISKPQLGELQMCFCVVCKKGLLVYSIFVNKGAEGRIR